jgi:hypothetical protein
VMSGKWCVICPIIRCTQRVTFHRYMGYKSDTIPEGRGFDRSWALLTR